VHAQERREKIHHLESLSKKESEIATLEKEVKPGVGDSLRTKYWQGLRNGKPREGSERGDQGGRSAQGTDCNKKGCFRVRKKGKCTNRKRKTYFSSASNRILKGGLQRPCGGRKKLKNGRGASTHKGTSHCQKKKGWQRGRFCAGTRTKGRICAKKGERSLEKKEARLQPSPSEKG